MARFIHFGQTGEGPKAGADGEAGRRMALVSRFNSRTPTWFSPGARNQTADYQVLRSSKGARGKTTHDRQRATYS
jgi:hypothetical protein